MQIKGEEYVIITKARSLENQLGGRHDRIPEVLASLSFSLLACIGANNTLNISVQSNTFDGYFG